MQKNGMNEAIVSHKHDNEKATNEDFLLAELPTTIDEWRNFIKWVAMDADAIYVEQVFGWRERALQEMYEAYLRNLPSK